MGQMITLLRFKRSILRVSFTKFLKCFSVIMFYVFLLLCVAVEITLLYLVSLYLAYHYKSTILAYMSLVCLAHCVIELFT